MDDKLKIFWNLDVLVKMSRSKSDGPSLRIEENELKTKVKLYKVEIDEINTQSEEESYDSSAEMADRNIEIITKKQIQNLRVLLKENTSKLERLKEEEKNLYENTALLRDTKDSFEKYISSMQDRIGEATEYEVIDRYNALIAETSEKISNLTEKIKEESTEYSNVQNDILSLTEVIKKLEDKIDKKKKLLLETQANLENKENYIDKSKKEKNNQKIAELEQKIKKLETRIEEIRKDPKYIETKIKDVINNNDDPNKAKEYLVELVNMVIKQPYINVPTDNNLEEELLKATQARDNFANEIDKKNYNILDAETPEKIRIDFLKSRIRKWEKELKDLKSKISSVDKDEEFNYEQKAQKLNEMIISMKKDLKEFQKAYDETPDINIGAKASIKVALDEKREDIIEAEKIATSFRKDESDDIARTTRVIKYECEQLKANIQNAEAEIVAIKNRLTSKKSGAIDISSRNKDKDILKELAQTVIDIKHRRQFAETPLEIVKRLEKELQITITDELDLKQIENNSQIEHKDYDEYTKKEQEEIIEDVLIETELPEVEEPKRGIKVITETQIAPNETDMIEEEKEEIIDNKIENLDISSDLFDEEKIEQIIEETSNSSMPIIEADEKTIASEEVDSEEEAILDIGAIIEGTNTPEENEDKLTINTMFDEKDTTNLSSKKLSNELDEYLNNLDKQQA